MTLSDTQWALIAPHCLGRECDAGRTGPEAFNAEATGDHHYDDDGDGGGDDDGDHQKKRSWKQRAQDKGFKRGRGRGYGYRRGD